MGKHGTSYFKDNKRKIDFIIVYELKRTVSQKKEIESYLGNLRRKGIEMEVEQGKFYNHLVFVKLHAPGPLLHEIASIQNLILSFENDRAVPIYSKSFFFFKNKLAKYPDEQDPMFKRCTNVARGLQNNELTTAERILLVHYLLVRTSYGDRIHDYGLRKLLQTNTLLSAYPLHDSQWQWTNKGHLTDRQLLAEFWANAKSWYNIQPVHIIYNYYGSEVAFRYAWLGHYNIMLIPISILGALVFIYSAIALEVGQHRVRDICNSDIPICPSCMSAKCTYRKLSNSCLFAKLTFLFDNWTCVLFAILTSIWGTCFVEFWKRREVNLMFQWNILEAATDIEIMPEYEAKTPYRRISLSTGAIEAYVPLTIQIFHYCVSTFIILLMASVVSISTILVVVIGKILRHWMIESGSKFLSTNLTILSLICTSTLSTMLITIYGPGKLYTHPGDYENYIHYFGLGMERCHPSSCVTQVTVQLAFLMVLKRTTMKFITHGKPYIQQIYKSFRTGLQEQPQNTLPQWEHEFALNPIGELYFVGAMMDRILQYGLLLFFVSTLPLLPLIALIGNVVELRVTAHTLLKRTRRPVPRRLHGIGAWNGIIAGTTYISILCNAVIIAFTTDFVPRELYRMRHGSLEGYINSTLTEFAVKDFPKSVRERLQNESDVTTCYFKGYRHKPNEEDKYEPNDENYYILAMSFCFVIFFEHLVLVITGVLAYAIPDIPFIIKEYMAYEDQKLIELQQRK